MNGGHKKSMRQTSVTNMQVPKGNEGLMIPTGDLGVKSRVCNYVKPCIMRIYCTCQNSSKTKLVNYIIQGGISDFREVGNLSEGFPLLFHYSLLTGILCLLWFSSWC